MSLQFLLEISVHLWEAHRLCHLCCATGFQVSLVGACLISKSVDLDPAAA